MADVPTLIRSTPGIQRDGTQLDSTAYVDGQWVRFVKGLPRKMFGYRSILSTMPEISRGLSAYSYQNATFIHSGGQTTLNQVAIGLNGAIQAQVDRTPGAGFVGSANNMWQFASMQDATSGTQRIIAHAAQNIPDTASPVVADIFYGDVTASAALTDLTSLTNGPPAVSGGVVVLAPFLFTFSNYGLIAWSVPNKPEDFVNTGSGSAFITAQKIVCGLPLRNGSGGPAGLFWSIDSLIRALFVGSANGYFQFDTMSAQTSIMSSQCVIEYDGVFYWVGVDRFLMFNGIVQEVPNTFSSDWFFDNLNYAYKQKVFVFKVPRRGEIWWCYPRGSATECTHAVIFNVREQCWYDTQLPGSGRSAAFYSQLLSFPIMVDMDAVNGAYTLWHHETGTDQVLGQNVSAIDSYFETSDITLLKSQPPSDRTLAVGFLEPDFVQTGAMTVTARGRANANAALTNGTTYTFNPSPQPSQNQLVQMKEVHRLMRFRFESNTAGGDYRMGHTVAHLTPSDGRLIQ